ncbi:MAG: hypothetical protein V3U24_08720 [Candidatus Neomarinimicrobiota bacterium]
MNTDIRQSEAIRTRQIRRQTILGWAGVAVLLIYLYSNAPQEVLLVNKLLGVGILVTGLIPLLIYTRQLRISEGRELEPLPLIPVLGLLYGLYLGLPALIEEDPQASLLLPITHGQLTKPLELTLLGVGSFLVSFYLFSHFFTRRMKPLQLRWDVDVAKRLAIILLVSGFFIDSLKIADFFPQAFRSVFGLLSSFYDLGMGIFVLLAARNKLTSAQRKILWFGIVPYFFLIQVSTGLVSNLVYGFVFIFLLFTAAGYTIRWRWIVPGLLLTILLHSNVLEFRSLTWYGEHRGASRIERAQLFFRLTWESLESGGVKAVGEGADNMIKRIGQLSLFAYVMELTPSVIPYWDGGSYYALPTTWIPRALWPDKPEKRLGQEFGHIYGILDQEDRITSVNFPQIIEMYANFGTAGVLVGMAILGVMLRFLYAKLNQPGVSDPVLLLGAFIFKDLTNIESDFTLVFGAILQTVVVLYIVLRLAIPSKSALLSRNV